MTDLNAYESDYDSGLDYLSGEDDDIKARKKANRNRRPVSERWQEVLEDKARREGTVSYRMREPDEEVLEEARDEAKIEENSWELEWQARQSGEYESRLPDPDASAGGFSDQDQPAIEGSPGISGQPASGETGSPTGVGDVVSDWWSKMRGMPKSDDNPDLPATGEPDTNPATPGDNEGAANTEKVSGDDAMKAKNQTSSKAKDTTANKAKKKK
jgi:hypothetical protein